ncbi:MAG: hypothetical protein SPF30_03170 [Arcanobacterium sp.]|nr:hypothetical protein [Arcanobacterium sp.]
MRLFTHQQFRTGARSVGAAAMGIAFIGVPSAAYAAEAGTPVALGTLNTASTQAAHTELDFAINNPYAAVDWAKYGQYKADFHSHSNESDGSPEPKDQIEEHYKLGFDVMALTDHNMLSSTMDRTDDSNPNNAVDSQYLTPERALQIKNGVGRNGRGMTYIPYATEQSRADHLNTFWVDYQNQPGATLEENVAMAERLGGISHINHPGRYTGADTMANGGADGAAIARDPAVVKKYTDLFDRYNSLVGMEIINKKDGDSYSDRIMWDEILKKEMPKRPVWGFSNDDTHSIADTGYSYNMMLMPTNNEQEVRKAMVSGSFYAVALVAKRELGNAFQGNRLIPAPSITAVVVKDGSDDSITVEGKNYSKIQWIIDGKVVAEGNTLDLNNYESVVHNYVRVQLIGENGIAFSQPFGISVLGKRSVAPAVDGSSLPNGGAAVPGTTTKGAGTGAQAQPTNNVKVAPVAQKKPGKLAQPRVGTDNDTLPQTGISGAPLAELGWGMLSLITGAVLVYRVRSRAAARDV